VCRFKVLQFKVLRALSARLGLPLASHEKERRKAIPCMRIHQLKDLYNIERSALSVE
jgi:hypothetical protein